MRILKCLTTMKNTLVSSSPLSLRVSRVLSDSFVLFDEIESVSLNIEADKDGVTNSSIIFLVIGD